MGERRPISKRLRFEVFKRDHFMCQYCGRKSPDIILEVDHIKPIAEGGTNDFTNLITSCRDCNRGKGKRLLNDRDEILKQQNALEELAERKEQMEMISEWRMELLNADKEAVDRIVEYWETLTGIEVCPPDYDTAYRWVKQFNYQTIYDAMDRANEVYVLTGDYNEYTIFHKVGGIAYNMTVGRTADYYAK